MADDPQAQHPTPPGQPRGRTGTEPRTARSPLGLRLLLAVFGVLLCGTLAVLALTADEPPPWLTGLGIVLAVLAVAGVVDAFVVSRRLQAARGSR